MYIAVASCLFLKQTTRHIYINTRKNKYINNFISYYHTYPPCESHSISIILRHMCGNPNYFEPLK